MEKQPLLQMAQINKSFPGVQALQDVDLTVYPGEILALLGENGAGKSTLMKILNGVYPADSGTITWKGQAIELHSPHDAQAHGISMIHQELALIPYLDAGKNIYLGREPQGIIPGTVHWRTLYQQAQHDLDTLDLDINARTPVRFLSIAQQQMIEVTKALSIDASLIVMDEPTSSLTEREVETLFAQMNALRERGVSIIFISHRLEEVQRIADRMTVLRDGQLIDSELVEDVTTDDIIHMMVGRKVGTMYEKREQPPGDDVILKVIDLCRGKQVQNVSFELHRGEVLGIAGLVGAGRTELAEIIFGVHSAQSGSILFEGQPIAIQRPQQAIRHGIGFVPEDRKRQGLFMRMSVSTNIVITALHHLTRWLFIQWNRVRQTSQESIDRLTIRTPTHEQRVCNLSGGNQQKVVIARWLTLEPKVLILDEPTRGIDVGAKAEIYRLINRLAERGVSILMISSELPEVMGISDRILVMYEGRITGQFEADMATEDMIMTAATGSVAQSI